jgi:1-acyl-sn-glycerol-3-phosphate acyltransferase
MAEIKPQVYKDPRPAEYFRRFHQRARTREPDAVYDLARIVLTPPTLLVYRARAIGTENVPRSGPVILAPNHFSNWDHFFAGIYLRRRVRFMGKSQLFGANPAITFIISHGGVFPVRRGHKDQEAFVTAHAILDNGGCVLIYAEGGRSRTGGLGQPRPGVGYLALESGVPVVPVAIHGSKGVRRWRKLQFPKVTIQYGEPLTFEAVERPSREQAQEVAERVFEPVREMYAALEEKGRRGVIKALREGIGARTEHQVPAGQPR